MSETPFGRQPEPVAVMFLGDPRDVEYWQRALTRSVESIAGNTVQVIRPGLVYIYPRAVND